MRSPIEQSGDQETDSYTELSLLAEVERSPETTQRGLASRLGISLGLTNLLVRNMARKGYLRMVKTNWRRRLYALTPQGVVRRVRLTWAYVNRFLNHYEKIGHILDEEFASASLHAESRVVLYGTGDLAGLVYLGLKRHEINEIAVVDPSATGQRFLGMPVVGLADLEPADVDRVIVAEMNGQGSIRDELLSAGFEKDCVITLFDGDPQRVAPTPELEADEESRSLAS